MVKHLNLLHRMYEKEMEMKKKTIYLLLIFICISYLNCNPTKQLEIQGIYLNMPEDDAKRKAIDLFKESGIDYKIFDFADEGGIRWDISARNRSLDESVNISFWFKKYVEEGRLVSNIDFDKGAIKAFIDPIVERGEDFIEKYIKFPMTYNGNYTRWEYEGKLNREEKFKLFLNIYRGEIYSLEYKLVNEN